MDTKIKQKEIKMVEEKSAEIVDISEINKEGKVVDIKAEKVEEVPVEKKDTIVSNEISKEETKKLLGMADTIDSMLRTIGSLEAQKLKIIMQSENLRESIEKEARKALLDAGVPEGNVEEYRVDIRTGKISKHTGQQN
jgi:type IV pilus biogenesis protein CpaD/CtpE